MTVADLMLLIGALLVAGLALSLLAGRLRLPSLLLFLGLGMAVGSDGMGWIAFEDYALAQHVGIVALALILFEGGLTAAPGGIRPVLGPSLALAVVGTLITAVVTGLVAAQLFGYSTVHGLLLGSILASTDGAAVFAVLRGSSLRGRLAQTLEGEAGFNDPIAVLLVVGFVGVLTRPGYGAGDVALLFVRELGLGALLGGVIGMLAIRLLRRLRLPSPGLYPVASLATAAVSYGAAASVHGSGFLAVFVAGLLLGGADVPERGGMVVFHEALAWVAQIGMFFTLGLLVFPNRLGGVALTAVGVSLVLVFVARPLAAYLATTGFGFRRAERLVLGWSGLRGAVPVVLATFPVLAHVRGSAEFFDVAFFVVLLSTLVQGATIDPLARWLGASTPD